jgi:ABC-type lipoprotein release transport system permease subunit
VRPAAGSAESTPDGKRSILPDIRFGWRILAIALGIGVNGMMFTIHNAALFKTLVFENPGLALPIGIAFAIAVSRLVASALFEVALPDVVTFVSIPVMLSAIVVAACLVPARRAARLRPVDALRTE